MSDIVTEQPFQVPVSGGELQVARWGDGGPTVLALHGITASHMSWREVAARLPAATLVAPDLGAADEAPGWAVRTVSPPMCGILVALLDAVGARRVVVVGFLGWLGCRRVGGAPS